jgi:hypothetical protein
LAAIVAWLVFLVCINASIKAVNLFKRSSKWPFCSTETDIKKITR